MRFVCVSDTHTHNDDVEIPDGDVFLHAGDITGHGERNSIEEFNRFLGRLPHRHKIVIAGNHDFPFQDDPGPTRRMITNAIYLQDAETEVEGIRIWGSPWQPWFFDWAFNLKRGPEIRAKWDLIPDGIEILMTHGPPWGHGDQTSRGEKVGCRDLLDVVQRIRPRYHVFGHIHEGYGITRDEHTTFINASICDLAYDPVHAPVVFDLPGVRR